MKLRTIIALVLLHSVSFAHAQTVPTLPPGGARFTARLAPTSAPAAVSLDIADLVEQQLAAGQLTVRIPPGNHVLNRTPRTRNLRYFTVLADPGANIACTAGLDLLGCIFPRIEGGHWIGQGAPFGVLLGRWPTSASANYPTLRNVEFDGAWRDAAVIVAAAEVGVVDACCITNTRGTAVLVCNQYGDSVLSTMQEFSFRDCQLSSGPTARAALVRLVKGRVIPGLADQPPAAANGGACILSDIHFDGGGCGTSAPLAAVVALELVGDPGQADVLTFARWRAECLGARCFLGVSGNNQTAPGWLALRDCTIDITGPLVAASGFTLVYPSFDAVKWNYAGAQTPLLQCAAAVNPTITATAPHAGIQISQLQPLQSPGGR